MKDECFLLYGGETDVDMSFKDEMSLVYTKHTGESIEDCLTESEYKDMISEIFYER